MFDRTLHKIRELVRRGEYVITIHADEELDADQLGVLDVEECILTGRIVERQKDRSTGEWKYLIEGRTSGSDRACAVAKLGPTGKVVILTAFAT